MERKIYTLGPQGTDSEAVGKMLSPNVVLCSNFREAFEGGVRDAGDVLCPAGYVKLAAGQLVECWADLHFSFEREFEEVRCFVLPTKPMALYESSLVADGRLICHPTTKAIAEKLYSSTVEHVHVHSKPVGRKMFEEGAAQFVLCSRQEGALMSWERELATAQPSMVWVHYRAIRA